MPCLAQKPLYSTQGLHWPHPLHRSHMLQERDRVLDLHLTSHGWPGEHSDWYHDTASYAAYLLIRDDGFHHLLPLPAIEGQCEIWFFPHLPTREAVPDNPQVDIPWKLCGNQVGGHANLHNHTFGTHANETLKRDWSSEFSRQSRLNAQCSMLASCRLQG
jgi:hypothetical protein